VTSGAPSKGRSAASWLPWILRGGTLLVVLLLLLDPRLPGEDPARAGAGSPDHWVIVELHPALAARAGPTGEALLLDEARTLAREHLGPGTSLALAGPGEVEALLPAALDALGPGDLLARDGDLSRATLRIVEAGARRLTVISPLRDGTGELARTLRELPVPVEVLRVGGSVRNAAVIAIEVPETAVAGQPIEGAVVVGGEVEVEASDPDEAREVPFARVRIAVGDRDLDVIEIPLPPAGTRVRVPFRAEAPGPSDAPVRVRAEVELEGDRYPFDDALERRLPAAGRGGLVIVSTVPDAEPRVLLPLLERASGLPGEGWIRVGEDRFLALGGAADALRSATGAEVARAMERARLVVFQGPAAPADPGGSRTGDADAGPAARSAPAVAAAVHPRRLLLAGAGAAPVSWRVDPEIPVSPLSGFLVEVFPRGGPAMLAPVLATPNAGDAGDAESDAAETGEGPGRGTVALRYRAGGITGGMPAVVLTEGPTWRQVEVRGSGFWRWAAGDPSAAAFHRALWAGAAAWLLAGEGRGGAAGGTAVEPAPPSPTPAATALLVPPGEPEAFASTAEAVGTRAELAADRSRRLRSHPLPWLLVALLLSAEWILRRRLGLR
jgi:hypothetical protein